MSVSLDPEIYRVVLECMQTGVYLVDRDRKILFWNDGAERITGYHRHEVIGRCCPDNILDHCDESHAKLCGAACPLLGTIHDGLPREATVYLRHKEGYRVPVHVRAAPIRDAHGAITAAVETFDEVHQAFGPDRRGVLACEPAPHVLDASSTRSRIGQSLEEYGQYGIPFGILCIEIRDLEGLRKAYGVRGAEAIAFTVEQTVLKCLRLADVVGRWPGHKLVAILPGCQESGIAGAAERMKKLAGLAATSWWGDRITARVSVGATVVRRGDTVDSILSRAEDALRAATVEDGAAVSDSEDGTR